MPDNNSLIEAAVIVSDFDSVFGPEGGDILRQEIKKAGYEGVAFIPAEAFKAITTKTQGRFLEFSQPEGKLIERGIGNDGNYLKLVDWDEAERLYADAAPQTSLSQAAAITGTEKAGFHKA